MSVFMDPADYRKLPVIVLGAGPIGLAAAAHLASRGESYVVLEQGAEIAPSQRDWAHVHLFTPWKYNIDPVAGELLAQTDWSPPPASDIPTGGELRDLYLMPLAQHQAIAPHIRASHKVISVSKRGVGLTEDHRIYAPFEVTCDTPDGRTVIAGRAVIDASGTWLTPNPLAANGVALPLEGDDRIASRIPDVLGADRAHYADRHTLVAGSGHSAMGVVRDLVELRKQHPNTRVTWLIRANAPLAADCTDETFLTERALLRQDTRELVATGDVSLIANARIIDLSDHDGQLVVSAAGAEGPAVDRIVACTGFRPDHSMLREVRTDIHPVLECVFGIGDIVDPDRNACGTVPPHGVAQLQQPEPNLFIVGSKSYGRCGTFLLFTGYEQVRSVVAVLCEDESALEVMLELPERGLCSACDAWLEEHGDACACSDDDSCCVDDEVGAEELAHA